MHYTFHHIPKTGGSSLRVRLKDRADKKQISKLDYAQGHNTTKRTPGIHFTWLRDPLDRDISQFNYDMSNLTPLSERLYVFDLGYKKKFIDKTEANTFENTCQELAGNFITLWLYKNYLLHDPTVDINSKYITVRQCLKNNFQKVFSIENFEQSWNEIADLLKVDREPRLNTNRSDTDYKKYADKKKLSKEFIEWHKSYNHYDYKLFEEFCT
jgi:hypothetical protein